MSLLCLLLAFAALVLFGLAFFNAPANFNLTAGGLFLWLLAEVLPRLVALHGLLFLVWKWQSVMENGRWALV